MPDLPRHRSPRSQSRPSGRPAYDRYQQDDQRYDRPPYDRRAGPDDQSQDDDRDPRKERGRGDLRVQFQSRRRSRHDEDKARLRRAHYPEEDEAELEWRRLRYREEDRNYERALRAGPRSPGKRSRSPLSDSREYDEYDETPARYSRRSDRWLTGYWSKVHLPSHFPDQVSRYMEKVQTVFTRSMQATKRAKNRLLVRFAQLQPWQRVAIVALLITAILGPSLLLAVGGYQQYTQIKVRGADGIQRLLAIKVLISTTGKGLGIEAKAKTILQPGVLLQIKQDSDAALSDFEQVNAIVNQHLSAIGIAGVVPILNTRVAAVGHLARVGID